MSEAMKPSEAIREGRKLFPKQIFNEMCDGNYGACAVGDIIAGYNGREVLLRNGDDFTSSDIKNLIPNYPKYLFKHPITKNRMGLFGICMSLNDTYKWEIEKIAKYLEKQGL